MDIIVSLLSYLYPMSLINGIAGFMRLVRSKKISRQLLSCGPGFHLRFPYSSLRGLNHITVGKNFRAGGSLILTAWKRYKGKSYDPQIIIGDNTLLGENAQITAINRIQIGDNLLTGKNIFISDHNHGETSIEMLSTEPINRDLVSKGAVEIGNNVWLGNNVCILSGTILGDNVIVGANAVVCGEFPANCVIGGVPARIIKCIK